MKRRRSEKLLRRIRRRGAAEINELVARENADRAPLLSPRTCLFDSMKAKLVNWQHDRAGLRAPERGIKIRPVRGCGIISGIKRTNKRGD